MSSEAEVTGNGSNAMDVKQEQDHDDGQNGNENDYQDGQNGSTASQEAEQFRKLFIGGLSLSTTDESLRQFYGKYGTIVDCIVMRDGVSKKSRGFGFVSFSSKAEVDKAMAARPHVIDNKNVDPKRAVPREQSARGEANVSTTRLYVSGVRDEHTEDLFTKHFSDYGKVTKAEIITDKSTNKPRGFGFVTFEDYDSVDKCVLQKSHMIGGYRCDVKKALSRDEMSRAQQMDRDREARGARTRGGGGGPRGGYGGRGGPGGSFREPHGYGSGPWASGPPNAWGTPPAGQWGGYGAGGYGGGAGGYGGGGAGYGGGGSAWAANEQWSQGGGGGHQGGAGGWAQQKW